MKVIQLIGGVVILFILFSCTKEKEVNYADNLDGSIDMRYNVQRRVSDNLLLEIIELIDTRCPVGSVCNEAGNVQIGFRVFSDEGITTTTVYYNDFQSASHTLDTIKGHTLEVVKVTPYPFKDELLKAPQSYTVTVIVTQL